MAAASCAELQSSVRDYHNEDMVGQIAPELRGGAWIGGGRTVEASTRYRDWTLVAFFRPWDSVCIEEVPRLAALHEQYSGRGLSVVGVTEAPLERAQRFVESYAVPYPVITDARETEILFGVEMLWGSEVFLVDPGGIVVANGLRAVERRLATELGG
ncbi:MAG: TlpA disulfide reductase family protein [Planctomycetota bacterium]